jgi:YVTN family beta-propeller protein
MRSYLIPCLTAAAILAGCGGNDNSASGPRLLTTTSITGVGTGTNFGFDIGNVSGNRYYLTDRNNAAVDVFDTATSSLISQIKGSGANAFAGSQSTNNAVDNSISGPNGVYTVGNLLYVGDVNSVKIVDPSTQQVIKTIQVGTQGKRADEGCVDAAHNLFIIATPEATTPYLTVINTTTQSVVGTITFTDASGAPSAGLEACQYDAAGDTVYINNDGTTANPHGEFVAMPGASIRAIPSGGTVNYTNFAGLRTYSEGNCDPTGLAFGPGNEVAVGCREATTGAPLLVQIMDRTNGRIIASVNAGGGDEIAYDSSTNRYYNAASRWTASGNASTNGNCSAASPCTPVLAIIDATAHTVVTRLQSGNNAHSVAIDPATGKAFMPASSGVAPAGCATCSNEAAGLLTFAIK